MSAATDVNLKQSLRKLEYPLCSKESLNKIAELICGRVTSIKNMDLALDLMSEFIFCEVDRRGNKKQAAINPLQELQLIEILFEYFNNMVNEAAKNTVFLSLFSGTTVTLRSGVLSKLISIAIGIPSPSILLSASTWMQQLGNTSPNSCKLAKSLVEDYFLLTSSSMEKLKNLPDVAPQFVANFLTAIAENYFLDMNPAQVFPPASLLDIITFWITENNSLCIAAQKSPPNLPPGAIAMEATTPFAGLLRWCVLAPILGQHSETYCQLHLALLNSILEIPINQAPKEICGQHLAMGAVRYICQFVNDQKKVQSRSLAEISDLPELQLSLDRLAQAVQVSFSVKCVYGKMDDLINHLQILPYNKLMKIIIDTYKLSK